jgi:signal transduction histidine kinase
MIASTSHDMRTPLNTAVNMLLLIEDGINDERLKNYAIIASRSISLL